MQPHAILCHLRTTMHLKDDAFLPGTIMVRAGLWLLCWFHHEMRKHLSTPFSLPPFLSSDVFLIRTQSNQEPSLLNLLELLFIYAIAEVFNCCVIIDAT